MEKVERNFAEAVIKHLCLNGEISGVRFGPFLQILLNGNNEHTKGITGQIYLNIESRWGIYTELPAELPKKERDIEEIPRQKELEILNDLSYKAIIDITLGDTVPHLIITFETGQILFIYGHDELYESWQLGVSFQLDETCLVVACPGDGIAVWAPDSFDNENKKRNKFLKLNSENFGECKDAIQKLFWMYHDLVTSYGGFGHNIDFETFNYEYFFFSEITDASMKCYDKEVELLRQGSLVALGCEVVNLLDESRRNEKVYNFIKNLYMHPHIQTMQFEKEVLLLMLSALDEEPHDSWETLSYGSKLAKKLDEVYNQYVLSYYRKMLEEGIKK